MWQMQSFWSTHFTQDYRNYRLQNHHIITYPLYSISITFRIPWIEFFPSLEEFWTREMSHQIRTDSVFLSKGSNLLYSFRLEVIYDSFVLLRYTSGLPCFQNVWSFSSRYHLKTCAFSNLVYLSSSNSLDEYGWENTISWFY